MSWQPSYQTNANWQPSISVKMSTSRWTPVDAAAWYAADFEDTLFSDEAGTIPATSPGDPVLNWKGRVGGDWVRVAGTPQLVNVGTDLWVEFNRSRIDRMNNSITSYLRGLEYATIFTIYRRREFVEGNTPKNIYFYASTEQSSTASKLQIGWDQTSYNTGGRRVNSDTWTEVFQGTHPGDDELVAEVTRMRYGDAEIVKYGNGTGPFTSAFQTAGATEDADSVVVWLGMSPNWSSDRGSFDIAEFVIFKRDVSDHEIESFMSHARDHWGVVLAP